MMPHKMREEHYSTLIRMLRQNMKYAGALRINAIADLFRSFWVPSQTGNERPDKSLESHPLQGTYIETPFDELLAILILESQRNRCLLIGDASIETLSEVQQEALHQRGIFFQQSFCADPTLNSENKVIATGAPYQPTLSAFWEGRDITRKTEQNEYPDREARDQDIRERTLQRIEILSQLEHAGLLPEGLSPDPVSSPHMTAELTTAIHQQLARTQAPVLLVRFEDMLSPTAPSSLPHPSAPSENALPLESSTNGLEILSTPSVLSICQILQQERPRRQTASPFLDGGHSTRSRLSIPRATYRLQFNRHFTFRQAAELVPYLHRLGISHCYASPLLTAREGSQHGYDITDHKSLNQEIGSLEDFRHLAKTLADHDMGLIVDIVPNHMGSGKDNPWWMDVLENGPSSMYADYFDIDWQPQAEDLQNRILLAILGDAYGHILEKGELHLSFEAESGRLWLNYHENRMPICPESYPTVLGARLDMPANRLDPYEDALLEYRSILGALTNLPVEVSGNMARKEERMRERTVALNRLAQLCQKVPEVHRFIEENVQDFQVQPENPATQVRLHRLLDQQHYRLANWRVASDEINYRRFFDVNDLAAIRTEDPRVFNDTHALIFDLIEEGLIQGLRIDHPDGLYNPAAYFHRLQEEATQRLASGNGPLKTNAEDRPLFVLIEKILAPFERLPETWAVHGTTGYEFTNLVNGLFVRPESEKEMSRLYTKLLGYKVNFDELVYECKKLIMKSALNSELAVLSHQLHRLAKRNWISRDFTLHHLHEALMEVIACFPVYRTYVTPGKVSKKDREYIEWAIRAAKRRSLTSDTSIFDFIHQVLLLELVPESVSTEQESTSFHQAVTHWAMKFQQYTGPVMAKAVEDTSFYRYNRLISLNEVGGDPRQFGTSVATFHHNNIERARRMPYSMLSTSTHDTKRSEDVRARINVLSEMPDDWYKHMVLWRRMNRNLRRTLDGGKQAPTINDEYLFYQTLIGIWPLKTPHREELESLANRMGYYMLKAAREAKRHTSWVNPNEDYEEALSHYVRGVLLRDSRLFLDDFNTFQKRLTRFGLFNALSQTLLKLTSPGVPDIYQGQETWDFSLVDPDNRRPIDYNHRQTWLEQLQPYLRLNRESLTDEASPAIQQSLQEMLNHMSDGRIKQYVVATTLAFRAQHADLFREGAYLPLEVTGTAADHVIAFARQWEGRHAIIVAPRLLYTLGLRRHEAPGSKRLWKDTAISLPPALQNSTFRNVFTRTTLQSGADEAQLPLSEVLRDFPIALLTETTPSA